VDLATLSAERPLSAEPGPDLPGHGQGRHWRSAEPGRNAAIRVERGRYILAAADDNSKNSVNARPVDTAAQRPASALTEDEVKQGAKEYLEAAGFSVTVAWGHQRGVDISAVSDSETLFLEAKGSAQNPPQQVNYFIGALGELLQRMSDPAASYGLALPDNSQYRGLVGRLPALTWKRLRFTVIFISKAPGGSYTAKRVSA
jgi:hypothetical protein